KPRLAAIQTKQANVAIIALRNLSIREKTSSGSVKGIVILVSSSCLPKLIIPQIPRPLDLKELFLQFLLPPLFHGAGKGSPSSLTVLGNAPLCQQPLHPQPVWPMRGHRQMQWVTAPHKIRQSHQESVGGRGHPQRGL